MHDAFGTVPLFIPLIKQSVTKNHVFLRMPCGFCLFFLSSNHSTIQLVCSVARKHVNNFTVSLSGRLGKYIDFMHLAKTRLLRSLKQLARRKRIYLPRPRKRNCVKPLKVFLRHGHINWIVEWLEDTKPSSRNGILGIRHFATTSF